MGYLSAIVLGRDYPVNGYYCRFDARNPAEFPGRMRGMYWSSGSCQQKNGIIPEEVAPQGYCLTGNTPFIQAEEKEIPMVSLDRIELGKLFVSVGAGIIAGNFARGYFEDQIVSLFVMVGVLIGVYTALDVGSRAYVRMHDK